MRITSRQLRQIIREELLREAQPAAGTTSYEEELPSGAVRAEDPLLKALKTASAQGHKGVVAITTDIGDVKTMRSSGVTNNFEPYSADPYEDFLNKTIKPEFKSKYEAAFQDLAAGRSSDKYIRVPASDMVDGMASSDALMGITEKTQNGNTFTIQKVYDFKRYSAEETYKFLKDFINKPIKVYDAAEGEDKLRLIYPAAEREKVEVPTLDPKIAAWVEKTSKTPLRQGAKGDDVKTAQKLLVTELNKASSKAMGTKGAAFTALQNLLAQKKIEGGKDEPAQLTKSLAEKIEASGPDGIFGPMTYVAVQVFQDYARLPRVDGVIGKDTANALARGVERVSLADQPEQAPETPPTESEVGDVKESHVIARWNKLAGLIKG